MSKSFMASALFIGVVIGAGIGAALDGQVRPSRLTIQLKQQLDLLDLRATALEDRTEE